MFAIAFSRCWKWARQTLCSQVRLELWNGAGGDREKRVLRQFEKRIPELSITPEVWDDACDLARRCRSAGVTVPATDVVIAACARHHGAGLEHANADFDRIAAVDDVRGKENE